ncbi:MAG: hypothetical protein WA927_18140, partial [Rhodococcus sp. (in: high G+C Gram-positive bacteria)]
MADVRGGDIRATEPPEERAWHVQKPDLDAHGPTSLPDLGFRRNLPQNACAAVRIVVRSALTFDQIRNFGTCGLWREQQVVKSQMLGNRFSQVRSERNDGNFVIVKGERDRRRGSLVEPRDHIELQ